MAFHNNLLVNAAINGFVQGALRGRPPTGTNPPDDTAASYAALYAAALSYATSLDTLIANDGTISGGGGVTIAGSAASAAETANQYAKVTLVTTLSEAAFADRYPVGLPATAGFYAVQAAEVFAQYTEAVAVFTAQSTLA